MKSIIFLLGILVSSISFAENSVEKIKSRDPQAWAYFENMSGSASIKGRLRSHLEAPSRTILGMSLYPGDVIDTGLKKLQIRWKQGSFLALSPHTALEFFEDSENKDQLAPGVIRGQFLQGCLRWVPSTVSGAPSFTLRGKWFLVDFKSSKDTILCIDKKTQDLRIYQKSGELLVFSIVSSQSHQVPERGLASLDKAERFSSKVLSDFDKRWEPLLQELFEIPLAKDPQ